MKLFSARVKKAGQTLFEDRSLNQTESSLGELNPPDGPRLEPCTQSSPSVKEFDREVHVLEGRNHRRFWLKDRMGNPMTRPGAFTHEVFLTLFRSIASSNISTYVQNWFGCLVSTYGSVEPDILGCLAININAHILIGLILASFIFLKV